MEVKSTTGFYKVTNNTQNVRKNSSVPQNQPAFKSSQGLSQNQIDAIKAQHIAEQNIRNKKQEIPHITEKDINMQVTCVGCSDADGNTRNLIDFRQAMDRAFPNWKKNFYVPHIVRNGNGDEKYNGETTAIAIPLHPDTKGKRGGDHAVIIFNGNIQSETVKELVDYMIKTKILKQAVYGTAKKHWCHLNSDNPKWFFDKTNIRTVLVNFFKQKAIEQSKAEKMPKNPVKETDINISNYREQDKNNKRIVCDYRENFLKNGKKLTVGYSKFEENGVKKDMTVILIPTKENADDCVAVTIDNRKLSKQDCENMLNYLKYNNINNSEDEMFRTAIVNYLNK